jgi:hypothetical protein
MAFPYYELLYFFKAAFVYLSEVNPLFVAIALALILPLILPVYQPANTFEISPLASFK